MRELADAERIRRFMQRFGAAARREGTCYLAGGATAVLLGWRGTTIAATSSALYRFPAIDPIDFRRRADEFLRA